MTARTVSGSPERTWWRSTVLAAITFLLQLTALTSARGDDPRNARAAFLEREGREPAEYVLSKFRTSRVVILGEPHWVRHDPELVKAIVPRMAASGASALAMEMLPASEQATLDSLVLAPEWDEGRAMAIFRTEAWPYREYVEIVQEVWRYNRTRTPQQPALSILGLGPGPDWRRKLGAGETYDTFMARRVLEWVGVKESRKVLVFCGTHHAFTRYHQPELPRADRVDRFFERMGNVLWRELGEDVFLILTHYPWRCRKGPGWTACLPVDGAIDDSGTALRTGVGFDIEASPFAEIRIGKNYWFGAGYPSLRFIDVADGYIWPGPLARWQNVSIIPLSEFAPDNASLEVVSRRNPFSDSPGLDRPALEKLWKEEEEKAKHLLDRRGWSHLAGGQLP